VAQFFWTHSVDMTYTYDDDDNDDDDLKSISSTALQRFDVT